MNFPLKSSPLYKIEMRGFVVKSARLFLVKTCVQHIVDRKSTLKFIAKKRRVV